MASEWLKRLLDKETPISEYKHLSQGWDTCAVGEAHEVVPFPVRDLTEPEPEDGTLRREGRQFHEFVRADQRSKALACYLRIQRRVMTLAGIRVRDLK